MLKENKMPTIKRKSPAGHCLDWIRANPCPESGTGERLVHRWLFRCALACKLRDLPIDECRELLETHATRPVPAREMRDTLRAAYCANAQICAINKKPEIPPFDPILLSRHASRTIFEVDREWLADRSPESVLCVKPSEFLDCIFSRGERSFVTTNQKSKGGFIYSVGDSIDADKLNEYVRINTEGCWFLSNPVNGEIVNDSIRSEPNVTAWRYLVLESDEAPKDQWLKLLVQLRLPISAIYSSGGRSIHALVRVDCATKAEFDELRDDLRKQLCPLGADPAAMSAVRLTRLPSVVRSDNRNLQTLYYLNPNPGQKPIWDQDLEPF